MKALVVDDDLAIADVIAFTLRRAGYEVIMAHDGRAALERWHQELPSLVILDINMPKLNGLEVCREIRVQSDVPILILSVRADDDDVIQGLKLGADDYIVKPFSPRQLVARVEAVLRRSGMASATRTELSAGSLVLDASRSQLTLQGKASVRLTQLEGKLLEILMMNPGQILTQDQLIDHVWGTIAADRTMLKQLVYRLRQKCTLNLSIPNLIETVSGVGYTLAELPQTN